MSFELVTPAHHMLRSDTSSPRAHPQLSPTQECFFQTKDLSKDLKRRTARGAAATGLGQGAKFLLRFGSTAIFARMLTPEDYGLVAMTTVVTGFAGMFKDAGLTSATVQRQDITHEQVSTLFWINAALGCLIAIVLAAASPGVAAFYGDPRLTGITCALAVTFVFGGFTVQHQALLRRRMRFKALAVLEIASLIAGVAVGLIMALLGMGYWSLVGMATGTAVAHVIGVWVAVRWRPGAPRRGSGMTPLLRFGGDVLAFDAVNYFARQADNLLIGLYWGPVALGFYEKAYSMLMLPIGQINAPVAAVAVPALSRVQADPVQFRTLYLYALQLLASVTVPLVLGLAIFADEIVWLWLGRAWLECANLFRLLAAAAAVRAITNPVGWLLISLGHTKKYRQMGLANSAVIVSSFVIGLPYGARGIALCYSVAMCLLLVPTWWFVLRGTQVSLKAVFESLTPPFAACLPAGVVGYSVLHLNFMELPRWAWSLAGALGFCAIYALVLLGAFRKWPLFRSLCKELSRPT